MVCAVHNELHVPCDRTELADNQLVTDEGKVIKDVALEVLRVFWITIVGVVPDDDVRTIDGITNEADLWKALHRMLICRVSAIQSSSLLWVTELEHSNLNIHAKATLTVRLLRPLGALWTVPKTKVFATVHMYCFRVR